MATSTHALLPTFREESWLLEWTRICIVYVSDTCGLASSIWIRIGVDVEIFESGKIGPKHSPREKKYEKVVDSGFHAVDFGFPVMDCGFFVSGTWNPDSNR